MKTVEFGSLFTVIRNGMNVKQDKSGDGLPISRIETISSGTVDSSRVGYAGLAEGDCSGWILQVGDILFSHINSVEHVGRCAIYEGAPQNLIHGMNLLCLRCDPEKVVPGYVRHLIRSNGFRSRLSNFINKAVNQASVSIGNLKTIQVAVPSIAEQRRIAAILDKAEALRVKRREVKSKLQALRSTLLSKVFGDPEANPKGWPVVEFRELVEEFRYGTSNKAGATGSPALRIPNVIGGSLQLDELKVVSVSHEELRRLMLRDGDVLFVRTNGNPDFVGRCAIFEGESVKDTGFKPNEFIYASYLIRARLASASVIPVFIREFMLSAEGRRQLRSHSKTSAGQFNINTVGLGDITIPIPPLPIQREFGRQLKVLEAEERKSQRSEEALGFLFSALQHRAFRGEL